MNIKKKIIDFRFKSSLNEKLNKQFNLIARNKIKEFHTFISKISKDNNSNFDWWMSSPSGRYTLSSPLYFNYCSIYLLNYLIKNNYTVDLILVDNIHIKKIFENILKKNHKFIKVKCPNNISIESKLLLNGILSILIQLIKKLYAFIICKIINVDYEKIKNNKLILIDKYVFPGYVEKERYYIGLFEHLSKSQISNIFFVPTIHQFKIQNIWKTYNKLNNSKYNYFFKEKFIYLSDIIYAFSYFLRKKRIILKNNYVCDCDLSNVIRHELKDNLISYASAIESILAHRFIKNIKKKNYNVVLAIDWFENQINDRGWNNGFHVFYPEIETKGYRGLIPSDILLSEMYPTKDEKNNKMLPKKICVIGKGLINEIKKYDKSLNIDLAPAFRFQHIWDKKYKPSTKKFVIFIALPINFNDSLFILNLILDSLNSLIKENVFIYIKPHPTVPITEIKKNINRNIPNEIKIIEGNTENIILKANLLISGMSSICLEAIALGLPLLIIENNKKLNYRTIPKGISIDLYKYCTNQKELINGFLYFKNLKKYKRKQNKIKSDKIKKNYFIPVNKKNVYKFLNLKK